MPSVALPSLPALEGLADTDRLLGVRDGAAGLLSVDDLREQMRGPAGYTGWAPILASESADGRLVQKIVDWVGGQGSKPAIGYIGENGLVETAAAAVNILGATDAELAAIAALTPTNDDLLQRKAGAWTNRSPAQVKADLVLAKADVGLGNVDNTSDANKPISTATQTALNGKQASLGFTPENAANKGAANGYAPLGADSKINSAYIPAVAITDTWEVASQAAMLALTAQRGDIAIRTDENKSYVLSSDSPSTLADWKHLRTPTDAVLSVAGKTGAVTLVKADVGLGNVDNTSDANKPISTATQTALNAKQASDADLTAIAALSPATRQVLQYVGGAWTAQYPTESLIVAVGDEVTPITTGAAKVTFRMPYAFKLTSIRGSLTTASSSGDPAFDIKKNGVSIFSTTLTIDQGEKTSATAASAAVLSTTDIASDDEITIDVVTAGADAAGPKLYFIGYRTA